ncbi:ligated ion channel l-glutamate- and glycine-binding site domain-containing protein [Phthorimaea operculella]|nr:ligated ion channel l-glutamate- and glycine-binding site domain-containing protein [Phthorimaea operculella]
MQGLTPSPMSILDSLCKEFLAVNVSAILYLMNHEQYGRSTASAQYFLQLAGYLGIPVIAWNADNSGLEKRASHASLRLQLAPSIEHQTAAMLSILERYKWHQFSVVTSAIAGHDDFIQAVRERVSALQDRFKFTILNAVVVKKPADLRELVASEARVMLLYATREEAAEILSTAGDLHLTGENFVWIATQSVLATMQQPAKFPVGMLGVHFDTSPQSLINEIATAVKVFAYGVESYVSEPENERHPLGTRLSCGAGAGEARWSTGERFYRHLRNVSVESEAGRPSIEFTPDGELRAAELKIMNLRPGIGEMLVWEEIGTWNSYPKERLDIKDIIWPGGLHTPPQGVPEKFHMRITFLEEPPYIHLAPPDPISGRCSLDRGVLCRVAPESEVAGLEAGAAHRNSSLYQCCSGFCIDLLTQLAEQLGFTYELSRVEDGRWGTLHQGKWNGLINDLVNKKTDMVLTSLIINTDRESAVDFSVPFMETGVAIVVAKRTGIISPTAFLEPFDTASWMLVGAVAIQAATFSIFFFEWLSPSGFDCSTGTNSKRLPQNRFSLCRTYWIVWAVLFQASVHVDSPRGFTARFMTNMWAMFAVVFLAIYTANLAAFMITREEYHELSGVDDPRIARPLSQRPPLKFGTVPWSHTDALLAKHMAEPHAYMKRYNRSTVSAAVTSVLTGELDAFIYDGTVLDYLVSQDEDCRLLTVGSWYAMSGYGLAFTRNSKYVSMFNKRLLDLRANGDLERLRRYWMTGTCKPNKQEHKSSDPLALEQFLRVVPVLMAGILLAALLLLLEHVYFRYMREHLAASTAGSCCALVSLSMGAYHQ